MTVMRLGLSLIALSLAAPATAMARGGDRPIDASTCVCRTPELGEELLYPAPAPLGRHVRTRELGDELLRERTPELGEELVRKVATPELGDELLP
jgi:hypothetical protein